MHSKMYKFTGSDLGAHTNYTQSHQYKHTLYTIYTQ